MNNCRRHYFVGAAPTSFFIGDGVIVKMVQKAYKLLSQKLFADAQAIPLSELVANYYFRTLPLAYGHAYGSVRVYVFYVFLQN